MTKNLLIRTLSILAIFSCITASYAADDHPFPTESHRDRRIRTDEIHPLMQMLQVQPVQPHLSLLFPL